MKYIYDDKKLNYVPYVDNWAFLRYLGIILLSLFMFLLGTMTTGTIVPVQQPARYPSRLSTFSELNLKLKLQELCIEHPEIVLKQAKLETGNFTSELFLKGNNLFGMKIARIRPRLQRGEYKVGKVIYAKYDTWEESVIDYALWQSSQCSNKTAIQYLSYLGNYYATDPDYSKKIIKL